MGLFDAFGVGGGDLSIQLQFPQVQAGAVIQGVAVFAAGRRAQQITNIRVTFNCTTQRFMPGQPHAQQHTEAVAPPAIVSGPFTTQPGQHYQFPFQIQVPPGAFSSQPNVVSYRIVANADIDGEVDPGAGVEVQVIGTPYQGGAGYGAPGMMPMGGPQHGYEQGGYGGGYHDKAAYAEKAAYADKAAYAEKAAYADKGGYVDQGYVDKGGYADKGGYVDPNYAAKGGYADQGYADKGGYVDPNYAAKGGYADQGYGAKGGYGKGGMWAPGTRAQAQWTNGGWYGVTVVEQNGEMVLVQWDDGTPASWVRLDQIAG